jgi:hypothetical protein
MLRCRREDWAKVNEMFGTNVEVDFSETWKLTTSQLGMVGDENADIEANGSSPEGTEEDHGSTENIEFESESGERDSDASDQGDSVQESRGDGGVVRGESGASSVNGNEFELDVHVSGSVEEGTSSLETGRVESENEKEKENG